MVTILSKHGFQSYMFIIIGSTFTVHANFTSFSHNYTCTDSGDYIFYKNDRNRTKWEVGAVVS